MITFFRQKIKQQQKKNFKLVIERGKIAIERELHRDVLL